MRVSLFASWLTTLASVTAVAVPNTPAPLAVNPDGSLHISAPDASSSKISSASNAASSGFVLRTGLPRNIAYHTKYPVSQGGYIPVIDLIQHNTNITHVILFVAELDHNNPKNITIGGPVPSSPGLGSLWADVKKVQAAGVKVLASLGGAGGDSFLLLQQNFAAYYPTLEKFLKDYNLDGIDLDIEPASGGVVNGIATPLKLIQTLRQDFPADFLITMAPVASDLTSSPPNFSGFSYKDLDNAAVDKSGKKMIDWFNGQFYGGWGSPASTADYDACISNGYTPDRVVMGVFPYNEGSGYVPIGTLKTTLQALHKKYPKFGGLDAFGDYQAGSSDKLSFWQWYGQVYTYMT